MRYAASNNWAATDEGAREFYLHHGFEPLEDDPNRLFLPVSIIAQVGISPSSE